MKALWRTIFIPALLAIALISCEKDRNVRGCEDQKPEMCSVDSSKTHIRIFNFTKYPICDFKLFNNEDTLKSVFFGYIPRDSLTCYIAVDTTILAAGYSFNIGVQEFKEKRKSNSPHTTPKSFVTYNVFLGQNFVKQPNGDSILVWQASQTPVVDQY